MKRFLAFPAIVFPITALVLLVYMLIAPTPLRVSGTGWANDPLDGRTLELGETIPGYVRLSIINTGFLPVQILGLVETTSAPKAPDDFPDFYFSALSIELDGFQSAPFTPTTLAPGESIALVLDARVGECLSGSASRTTGAFALSMVSLRVATLGFLEKEYEIRLMKTPAVMDLVCTRE